MSWVTVVAMFLAFVVAAFGGYWLRRRRSASAPRRFASLLASTEAALAVWDRAGRLVLCNDLFRAMFPSVTLNAGLEYEDLVRFMATRAVVVVPRNDTDAWIDAWLGRLGTSAHDLVRTPDGRTLEMRTEPTDDDETLLTLADVTASSQAAASAASRQARSAERTADQEMVGAAAALGREASSFHGASRRLIEIVAGWGRWQAGTVYLVTAGDGARFSSTGVWFITGEDVLSMETRRQLDACAEEPDDTLTQAAATRRPVWIGNLDVDPRLSDARREALTTIRSLCAVPVVSDERVVAVVEWFAIEPEPPNDARAALMVEAVGELTQVFERERSTQLAEAAARRSI